jgi:Fe-S oxidoreductase
MTTSERTKDFSSFSVSPRLREALQNISDRCISCELCQQECAFLQEYGKPKHIADSFDPHNKDHQGIPFECSLCELCAAVCPVEIHPAKMFLEMRREAVRTGQGDFSEHGGILAFEKRGTSQRFSYYALPPGCDTVFFPGCALPGTRPDTTWSLFEHLRKTMPTLGIVLDCCTKPSHDLGRDEYFTAMFEEMRDFLLNNGVRQVIVACPNCYKVFHTYGDQLAVQTVYEFLARNGLPAEKNFAATITVHDPCAVRYESGIHAAVRDLCARQGLSLAEMPHHGEKTLCCGEGGSVGFITPELAKKWAALRKDEADASRIVTYCAGCVNFLGAVSPTSHVLDLLFQPEATMAGKVKVAKSPITYLNRLRLKKRIKNTVVAAITRERTFTPDAEEMKGGLLKRLAVIALIIGAIAAIRFSGGGPGGGPDAVQ